MIKRGKKEMGFFFSVRGEGKCEIDNKKKEKFFSPSGSFLTNFCG